MRIIDQEKLRLRGFDLEKEALEENCPPKGRISFLSIDLEAKCQANCLYCFAGGELNKQILGRLSLEEYKDIIDIAAPLGCRTVVFPGVGEPTLDDDLPDLVAHIKSQGLTSVIFTNCLFDPSLSSHFYENNVSLLLKIDTLNPKTYGELNGGDFDRFGTTFSSILDAYGKGKEQPGVTRLGACTVVTALNASEIAYLRDFSNEHGLKHYISGLSYVGWARDNWKKLTDEKEEELRDLVQRYSNGNFASNSGSKCGLFCYGITINANGDYIGCPTARWIRLGNVRDISLPDYLKIYTIRFDVQARTSEDHYCLARDLSNSTIDDDHDS